MADDQTKEQTEDQAKAQQVIRVNDSLEYVYRDIFNIYVSQEEVLLEFGNKIRPKDNEIVLGNRIVLSIPNAIKLQNALAGTISKVQKQLQEKMIERNAANQN